MKLSAVVTSYNNAATLDRCLASLGLADQILLLDSFSSDACAGIGFAHGATVMQQCFQGFGPQKQRAADLATHDWILLLDADEALTEGAQAEIAALRDRESLAAPGYRIRRREWLAWREPITEYGRWQGPLVRLTDHLRLFDRRVVRFSHDPVHAVPHSDQRTPLLSHELLHWGDAPCSRRLNKQQHYAELLAAAPAASQYSASLRLRRWLAPPAALLRDLLLRRCLLDGPLSWRAAWCSAQCMATRYRALLRNKHPRSRVGES